MRTFELTLPHPAAQPSDDAHTGVRALRLGTPEHLYIPRMLERDGLAGYETETLACFLATAQRSGGPVFDVGANIGVFALLAAAVTDADVVAFEPTPELAQVARDLATDNDLSLDIEQIALGAENTTAVFHLSSVTDASNSLLAGFRPSDRSITVTVETLDGYCARTGRIPAVLKVDTEATEPDVLRGGIGVIAEHRPSILCEVLARRTEAQLEELLAPLGYTWYQITNELPLAPRREIFGDRSYRFNNWLFAPEPPGDELWDAMRAWQEALSACTPPPKPKPRAAPVPHPPRAGHGGSGAPEPSRSAAVESGSAAVAAAAPKPPVASEATLPKPEQKPRRKKRGGVYGRKKMLAAFFTGVCLGVLTGHRPDR